MKQKTIFWITTIIACGLMLFSAVMYLFNHGMVAQAYTALGYPTYLIYPLAVAKVLGVVAIVSNKSQILKEWAYIGFFYTFLLGFLAHLMVGDGQFGAALVGLITLFTSYMYDRKMKR